MIIQSTNRRSCQSGIARRNRCVRGLKFGATALLLTVSLTACQHTRVGSVPTDGYRTRHPIAFKEVPQTLDIPVGMRTSRLNSIQQQQIAGFAREAGERGDGTVQILVPSGSANESTANFLASKIRRVVANAGIRKYNVGVQAYSVDDPQAVAPIRLAYTSVRATVHQCGTWPDNISANLNNSDYYEFGCSSQANLAAIISNPSDLLHPRASTPADSSRRGVAFDKYRKGEPIGSEKEQKSASVSDVGDS